MSRRKKRSKKPAPPKKAGEIIAGRPVFLTDHAIARFIQRTKGYDLPLEISNPEKYARKLLFTSREDRSLDDVDRVKRLINNDFEEVIYLSNVGVGLRFVLKPKGNSLIVLTVETIDKR